MKEKAVGTCIQRSGEPEGAVDWAWSGQGWIYKNPEAFYHAPSEVCYVPEAADCFYTANDFLELSQGQPEIAEEMFLSVGWERPETWLDEQFRMGELEICPVCGSIFQCYTGLTCPHCKKMDSDREVMKMIPDGNDLLMGERIGDVLNECKHRKMKHYETEQGFLDKMEPESRAQAMLLLDDILEWTYQDLRTAYCAGVEDGIRIARKILSV
ncbi:MAG: hypothetical protein LUH04_07470 [Clostridium sp.]|nr:hypothetical protein [Clostridium sp.]